MKRKSDLKQEEIKRLLDYNPETGIFRWKEKPIEDFKECKKPLMTCATRNAIYAGKIAGNTGDAYTKIQIDGKNYPAHRLAWVYVNGDNPFGELDHKNRDKKDNRISNLRIATVAQNQHNYLLMSSNTSGVRGVSWSKQKRKWYASIGKQNENIRLGSFADFDEAVRVRYEAEKEYGYTKFNPESSAYKYLQELQ